MTRQKPHALFGATLPFYFASNHYVRLRVLEPCGSGACGNVFIAGDSHEEEEYALKAMRKSSQNQTESRLHARVSSHPSILTYYGNIHLPKYDVMVFDFIKDGDLQDYLSKKKNTLRQQRTLLHPPSTRRRYRPLPRLGSRSSRYQVGDVLIDVGEAEKGGRGTLKVFLADFGFASTSRRSNPFDMGTTTFMSPEVERGSLDRGETYSPFENDVWGLGMTFLMLITGGNRPWGLTVNDPTYQRFVDDPRSFLTSDYPSLSLDATNLLLKMLVVDPSGRADMVEIGRLVKEVESWRRPTVEEVGGLLNRAEIGSEEASKVASLNENATVPALVYGEEDSGEDSPVVGFP